MKTKKPLLKDKNVDTYDCAIVGGGPAGLLAALYLKRYHRKTVVFNNRAPRASLIPKIHNLIGIEKSISGKLALTRLRRLLVSLQTPMIKEEVSVWRRHDHFELRSNKKTWLSKTVILATGVKDISPALPNIDELCAKGLIAYCPICDGYEHTGKPIALLVDQSLGLQKVDFLMGYCNQLHIVALKKFKISPYHIHLIRTQHAKIHRSPIHKLKAVADGLKIEFKNGRHINVHVAYIGLGVKVNSSAFEQLKSLKRTEEGFIKVNSVQRTSIKGLYAIGDCVNDLFQVSVASGHAAIAATDVHNYLST